jgi:hypothetical protein
MAAADKLDQWVHAGGTLYTSGGGLQFDEANQPLTKMNKVLGLKARESLEMWKRVELYKGTSLESYDEPARQIAEVPDAAAVKLNAPVKAELGPIVGREVLMPAEGTEIVGRFADGGAAVTRRRHGAGTAWVVGLFPGLEYSAPLRAPRYDMSRDLSQTRRRFVTLPCQGLVRPIVDSNHASVEGVLLKNNATSKLAVTLMNWTHRVVEPKGGPQGSKPGIELVPCENVKLRIRGTAEVARIRSAATGESLAATYTNDELTLTLPRLDEGDVLLLD